jgi:hypothetical protein
MEPEGSLQSLQELSTCTYPEPNQSSPENVPIKKNKIVRFIIYYEEVRYLDFKSQ